jgi:hypothetical protein
MVLDFSNSGYMFLLQTTYHSKIEVISAYYLYDILFYSFCVLFHVKYDTQVKNITLPGVDMKGNRYQIFREVTERICGDPNIEKALENCMHYLK